MKMMVLMSFSTSMLISLITNPMTMVIMIIIQSLIICLILFVTMSVSWYSYILFLIFMGGLMVLFIYICSIASNEMFSSSMNSKKIILLMMMIAVLTLLFDKMQMNVLNISSIWMINKMMEVLNMTLVLMTMFFLLFSLVVVVKISNMKMGPIRTFKK
uniref:NADH dehydrogenase subunit 6 n=1 Tax=Bourletiella arvalis TaxID=2049373 RepID=A0A384XAT6_9HEXA|nr:NADH dehydrogenase subunit 6 [Bourletiella arvalis]ATP01409.1 NADH dehydrogenase subunit 6 [Bourletiella arvalis]